MYNFGSKKNKNLISVIVILVVVAMVVTSLVSAFIM